MKEIIRYIKHFIFFQKRFKQSDISDYKLVFSESEYKRTRYAGYMNWLGEDTLTSTSEWKYGYFEIQTPYNVKLQSKQIPSLKMILNQNGQFGFEYLSEESKLSRQFDLFISHKHFFNKSSKSHKFGVMWTPLSIRLYVDDILVYHTTEIAIVKYYINSLRIITQGKADYVKVWQR